MNVDLVQLRQLGQRVRMVTTWEGTITRPYEPDDGMYSIITADGKTISGHVGDHITSVEVLAPSLPTEVGTLIVAAVPSRLTYPVVARLRQSLQWVTVDGRVIDPTTITEWRLLDGLDTVRVPEPEAPPAPAREERPCEGCDNAVTGCLTPCKPLPTGLGAVVRARVVGGFPRIFVLADPGDAEPWVGRPEEWCAAEDLLVVEVLSPGIEIPSPTTPEEG